MSEVYKAVAKVQAELAEQGIKKDKQNKSQGYNFRGIDDIYDALAPLLSKHQLCIFPRVLSREVTERTSNKGNALFYVAVEAEFDFVSAKDGSVHVAKTFGEAMDSGDKATNKAMSSAYKYVCFQTFCIPVEGESPDADATSHSVEPAPKKDTSGYVTNFISPDEFITKINEAKAITHLENVFKKYWGSSNHYTDPQKERVIKAKDDKKFEFEMEGKKDGGSK